MALGVEKRAGAAAMNTDGHKVTVSIIIMKHDFWKEKYRSVCYVWHSGKGPGWY